jgi:hypothetical protein
MEIVANEEMLRHYLKTAVEVDEDRPVLVDKYIVGKEVEVDAISDGTDVFLPGIMELVERTGVHSGDSTSVYPPYSISEKVKATIFEYTTKLGIGIGIKGLFNIQFIVDGDENVDVDITRTDDTFNNPVDPSSLGFDFGNSAKIKRVAASNVVHNLNDYLASSGEWGDIYLKIEVYLSILLPNIFHIHHQKRTSEIK